MDFIFWLFIIIIVGSSVLRFINKDKFNQLKDLIKSKISF